MPPRGRRAGTLPIIHMLRVYLRENGHLACPRCFADYLLVCPFCRAPDTRGIEDHSERAAEPKV